MATTDFPERLVNRVGYRMGCAIADHPVLGPKLRGALNNLPEGELAEACKGIEQYLGTVALQGMFPGGWGDD